MRPWCRASSKQYNLVLTGYDAYFDSITLQMLLDASQNEAMGKEFWPDASRREASACSPKLLRRA